MNTSLHLAYEFVQPSYELILRRLEAVEDRIQRLMVFVVTFTVGFPLVVFSSKDDVTTPVFPLVVALVVSVVSIFLLMWARRRGTVTVVGLREFVDDDAWFDLCEAEFMRQMLHFAAGHCEKNRKLIDSKSLTADVAVFVFLVEMGLLGLWFFQTV